MSAATGRFGVVSSSALDVRGRPEHRAEMTSQLLLGEVVRVDREGRAGSWLLVENERDGYRGWVRAWGVVRASARRARRWTELATAVVTAPIALASAVPGGRALVGPLFLHSAVIPHRRRAGHRLVELPDARRGWVPAAALGDGSPRVDLVARVQTLLGVPYLWGGRTPAGLDCSAFTQQVLWEQGLRLPRDAAEQRSACRDLAGWREAGIGDLLFFAPRGGRVGHVGLSLGGGLYAHARGVVRVASIDPSNALYEKDLAGQFVAAGRPLSGAPRGRRKGSRTGESA